jgi:hypothetical protein
MKGNLKISQGHIWPPLVSLNMVWSLVGLSGKLRGHGAS